MSPRLRSSSSQRTYLTRDGVFASDGPSHDREPRPVGTLSDYVHTLTGHSLLASAVSAGALGEAGRYVQQIAEFEFCLSELLPLLRSLSDSGAPRVDESAEIGKPLEALVSTAAQVQAALEEIALTERYSRALAKSLAVPCAVVGRAVIPLERIARSTAADFRIEIDGKRYRYCLENTRPLVEFIRTATQASRAHLRRAITADGKLRSMATAFLSGAQSILDRQGLENRERYLVVYRDEHHQLQLSHGSWLLVRGPVAGRQGSEAVFAALPITGRRRQRRLAYTPSVGRNDAGFWAAPGVPVRGGLCMGASAQYERLLSTDFTDAEAVVHWLDAGVILATGRSDFHRLWRARRERGSGWRRPAARLL